MSSLPALAIDNTAPQLPPRPMRLSDAEKIAADRLDTTSISSLKAALAGVTVNDALTTGPRLVERIDAAAKLAADATAAAEAVETLKRLLQAQLAASRPPARYCAGRGAERWSGTGRGSGRRAVALSAAGPRAAAPRHPRFPRGLRHLGRDRRRALPLHDGWLSRATRSSPAPAARPVPGRLRG